YDELLCAVGRSARLEGYGLEALGIETNRTIVTNEYLETLYPKLGVLLIPITILFLWFTAFGGSAVNMELVAAADPNIVSPGLNEAVKADTGSAIFKLMESYPLTGAVNLLIVVMIV
ncbi:BCCT family transporter, partial [Pseudoalteromonas sp. SIMBA_153]